MVYNGVEWSDGLLSKSVIIIFFFPFEAGFGFTK